MGARNALEAYQRFSGKVPPLSLNVLVYMCLVSKDADEWPYYRQGQHALAEFAMGRPNPTTSDLRAVQRAMKPLLTVQAITAERAGASRADGNVTARYRLNIHERADAARRAWSDTPDGKRRMSDGRRDRQHPTKSGRDTRRFVTTHPTVCDDTPDENRRPKETGGDMRSDKTKEEMGALQTASTAPREEDSEADPDPAPVVELFPGASQKARYVPPPGWSSRGTDAIAEATARRAAARAAHQAQMEAQ